MSGISNKELFLQHVAQTSAAPIGLEMKNASGIHIWDVKGKNIQI